MRSIIFPSGIKKYINLQCNGDMSLYEDMPDSRLAEDVLKSISPKKAIDIGAGIGRASVYFQVKHNWNCEYNYIDGDTGEKQLAGIRTATHGEYYNSHKAAKEFSSANGIENLKIWTPDSDWSTKIKNCDLAYSFLAVGFHWPLELYLDRIYPCMAKGAKLIFGMRGIENKPWVDGQIETIDANKYSIVLTDIRRKKDKSSIVILESK